MATAAELAIRLGMSGQSAVERGLKQLTGQLEAVGKAAAIAATAGLGIAATGAVALGKAAIDAASDYSQAMNDIVASTGMTEEAAKRLVDIGTEAFKSGVGANIQEATKYVDTLNKSMGGLDDAALKRATTAAAGLADTFGVDVAQTADAAKTLMDQFGLSSDQAFDFLAKGFQSGLNRSGDFLDTITEYSTQFKAGGASAEQFFSLLQSGMQGGVLGTDKAADAYKEFRVRIQDGSKLTHESLTALGIDAEELGKKMASGQMTATDAFQLVLTKLRQTNDSTVRMQAGVGLLGTQFEDLGTDGALALDMTKTRIEDMAGATDKLAAKYKNLGSFTQGLWRRTQVALIPVGQELMAIANDAMPMIEAAFSAFEQHIPGWIAAARSAIASLRPIIEQIAGIITTHVLPALKTLADIAQRVFSGDLRGAVSQGLSALVDGRMQLVESLAGWARSFIAWVGPMIPPMLDALGGAIDAVWQWIKRNGPTIVAQLQAWGKAFVEWVTPMIPPMLKELGRVAKGVGDWIKKEGPPLLEAFITEWVPAAVNWLLDASKELGKKLGPFLSDLFKWIEKEGPNLLDKLVTEWVPKFLGWVAKAGEKIAPKLLDFVGEIGKWIVNDGAREITSAVVGLGVAFVKAIGKGIWETDKWLWDELVKLAGEIKKWLDGGGAQKFADGAKDIGIAIVKGIAAGFAAHAKWLWEQISNFATSAAEMARQKLTGAAPKDTTGGGGGSEFGGGPPSFSEPPAPPPSDSPGSAGRGVRAYSTEPSGMSAFSLPTTAQTSAASAQPAGVTVQGPIIEHVTVQSEADETRLAQKIRDTLLEEWHQSTGMATRTPSGTARRI